MSLYRLYSIKRTTQWWRVTATKSQNTWVGFNDISYPITFVSSTYSIILGSNSPINNTAGSPIPRIYAISNSVWSGGLDISGLDNIIFDTAQKSAFGIAIGK